MAINQSLNNAAILGEIIISFKHFSTIIRKSLIGYSESDAKIIFMNLLPTNNVIRSMKSIFEIIKQCSDKFLIKNNKMVNLFFALKYMWLYNSTEARVYQDDLKLYNKIVLNNYRTSTCQVRKNL